MAAEQPSYMLAPNWDFPSDGPIALGSLIKDPKRPDRSLNSSTRVKVDASLVTTTWKKDWSLTRGDLHSGSVGLWASFLAPIFGVGGDVAINATRDVNDVFKCDVLETRYWQPDDKYIGTSLCSTIVKEYAEKYWWKSIYMIIGVKIAHGARMETGKEHGCGAEGKSGADGTPMGIPIGGGPKAMYERKKTHGVSFGASEGFVMAYRLLRIKPKKSGKYKEEDFNRFALLGEADEYLGLSDIQMVVESLRDAWEMEELRRPTGDDEWKDVELSTVTDLDGEDYNVLAAISHPQ